MVYCLNEIVLYVYNERQDTEVIKLEGVWDAGYSIHNYNDPREGRALLGEAIYRYLYRKQWYLVDSLARWAQWAIQASAKFKDIDLLVPVPACKPSADNYDPMSLLVDWTSQLTIIQLATPLARHGLIPEYSGTPLDQTHGGIIVKFPEDVRGRKVLLIDGIFCSGSTLYLTTNALRSAGAKSISVLAFAKIERQLSDSYDQQMREKT